MQVRKSKDREKDILIYLKIEKGKLRYLRTGKLQTKRHIQISKDNRKHTTKMVLTILHLFYE